MSTGSTNCRETGHSTHTGWGRIGQQILTLLEGAGVRAAELVDLRSLDRRELEDCGLTPADVTPQLPDLYAEDFRVSSIAWRHAA